jgi:2-polyprenyl-6-methoxyphenol hydroxylase-like FAD-dependent oxidoreductase
MDLKKKVLIVGAGPVGLTAALALKRLGMEVRIIDKNAARSQHSKALAVNARTLELLELSGVSAQLIAAGEKISQLQVRDAQSIRLTLRFNNLKHRYNFMLALPQSETEAILEENLQRLGVSVERNTEFKSLIQNQATVTAEIFQQQIFKPCQVDYLIGADGARSAVRQAAEISFVGVTRPDEWQLADVSLKNEKNLPAQIYLLPDRISVLLPFKKNTVRIISNTADNIFDTPLLNAATDIEEILWQSKFKIDYCQAGSYQKNRVFLAGDAAHIHSPAGGRGMNLGIEDAMVLASLMANGELADYTALRYPVGRRVIKITNRLTNLMSCTNPGFKFLRNQIIFPLLNLNFVQQLMLKKIVGLS